MKRTNSAANLPSFPTLAPRNTAELPGTAGTRSTKPAVKKIVPYLADDVHKRVLNLASDRERSTNRFDVKLQPRVYAPDWERPGFFDFPEDIYKNILPRLGEHEIQILGSSCHRGAQMLRVTLPMYRLPGLLGDLKRLRVRNLSIHPESFKAYLEAIAIGGDYDRVLLTPLSKALRCAVAIAMQLWAHLGKVHNNNYQSLVALNVKFIETNFDGHFLNGMKDILRWLMTSSGWHLSDTKMLRKFFNATDLQLATKSVIFQKFLEILNETDITVYVGSELTSIAEDFSLNLTADGAGILALLDNTGRGYLERLPKFLTQKNKQELKQTILHIINFGIDKNLLCGHSRQWLLRLTHLFLDAIREFEESDKKIILGKLISVFLHHSSMGSLYYGAGFDLAFNMETSENPAPAHILDGDEYENLYKGYLVKLLIDRAAELTRENSAHALLQQIYKSVGGPETNFPHFKNYMENKLAFCVVAGQAD